MRLRATAVLGALWVSASAGHAQQRGLSGPGEMRLNERAPYQLLLAGDPELDACDLTAVFQVSGGFRLSAGDDRAERARRSLARLGVGDRSSLEVTVLAPPRESSGELCATLEYQSCHGDGGPARLPTICIALQARGPEALPPLVVTCGTRPTVTPGGGTFDPAEWADAPPMPLGTSGDVTLYAKTEADKLYVALAVNDGAAFAERIKFFVNADNALGPAAVDRAFEVTRSDVGAQFAGSATGYDVSMPIEFIWEVDAPSGPSLPFTVEMEIPLTVVGGPAALQLAAFAIEGGPSATPEYSPVLFDGVDESLMESLEIGNCYRRLVPCASAVTVDVLGGTVVLADWADAAVWQVRTPALADLYMKTALGNLYFMAHVFKTASGNRVELLVNEDDSLGLPEVDDRRFQVRHGNSAELFGGSATGYDVLLSPPRPFDYESLDLATDYWVEMEIPLSVIRGPISPSKLVKIAVGIGAAPEPWPATWDGQTEDYMSDFEIADCGCAAGDFSGGPGCAGQAIPFTDLSTNSPTSWSWDFGDGTPPDPTQNPSHVFANPGTYTVTLTTLGAGGCQTFSRMVDVYDPPVAAVMASPVAFCTDELAAMSVALDASSTVFPGAPAASWVWTVPPGHSIVGSGPTVTWSVPAGTVGNFTAMVDVTDGNGCTDQASVDIEIFELPTADLVITPPEQCVDASTAAVFALGGTGSTPGAGATIANPGGYVWSTTLGGVGGGTASTETLTMVAGTTGTADVTLIVTDSHGCEDRITVQATANPDPIAALMASPVAFCTDELAAMSVALDASSTVFPGAPAASWVWTVPPGHSIIGSGPTVTWRIPAGTVGNFTAMVDVTDLNGCMHQASVDIEIFELPTADLVITPPEQCVNAATAAVFALAGTGSTPGAGATIANPGGYVWSTTLGGVGGGTASTETLTMVAGTTGTANVTLIVTDSHGCEDRVTVQATANPDPIAALMASPVAFCTDELAAMSVALNASGTVFPGAPAASWVWTVPPGHSIIGSGPTVTWRIPAGTVGNFTAMVDVTDLNGCTHQASVDIEIFELPTADLVITPPEQCVNAATAAVFALAGTGSTPGAGATIANPGGYVWSTTLGGVGGGTASTETLTMVAGTTGTANVTLIVTDSHGCEDRVTVQATANPDPIAALMASPVAFCTDELAAMSVALNASGTVFPGAPAASWVWTVPPGHSIIGSGPTVTWRIPAGTVGNFTAMVDVTDLNGCTHQASVDIEIFELPTADLVITPPEQCVNAATAAVFALAGTGSTPGAGATIANPGGYVWSTTLGGLGGGTASTETLTMMAGTTGTANVTLIVTDSHGCEDRVTVQATANPDPIAALMASPVAFCTDELAAMSVALNASGTVFPGAPAASWVWTVPPGHSIVGSGPMVDWSIPAGTVGNFTAMVDVTDGNGCMHRASVDIEIFELPTADLVITPASQCVNASTAALFALAGGGSTPGSGATIADPGGYAWWTTLGGVGGGTGSSETLTFPAGTTGTADVRLTVTDSHGCEDTIVRQAVAFPDPIADLTASPLALCTDELAAMTIALNASGSMFPGAPAASWVWTVPPGHSVIGSGPTVDWSIPAGTFGRFTAMVDITDGNGCMHQASIEIEIYELPTAIVTASPAAFCTDEQLPMTVMLDASGSIFPGAPASGWVWTVPPGHSIVGSGPTVDWSIPAGTVGLFTALVDITDGNGCARSGSVDIEIFELPTADLVITPPAQCVDAATAAVFALAGSGSLAGSGATIADPGGYVWTTTLGGVSGGTGSSETLTMPPGTTGTANVTLMVTDSHGCQDMVTRQAVANPDPVANLTANPVAFCTDALAAMTVALDASGTLFPGAPASGFVWTVPPGHSVVGSGAMVDWNIPAGTVGVFAAMVDVTDGNGCIHQASVSIEIYELPTAALVVVPPAQCVDPADPALIVLDASASTPGANALLPDPGAYAWWTSLGSLGGGSGSTELLTIPPGTFGTANVTVTTTDTHGCGDTATAATVIYGRPTAAIVASPTELCSDPTAPVALLVTLDATGTVFPDAPPANWMWTVPPGHTIVGAGPVVDWIIPAGVLGTLTASVDVTDGNGCVHSASTDVDVYEQPSAALVSIPMTQCVDPATPAVFALDATATLAGAGATVPDPGGYTWSTTLGTVGAGAASTETLTIAAGTYGVANVTVTALNTNRCSDSITTTATAFGRPTAALTVSPDELCTDPLAAMSVRLDATGTVFPDGAAASWVWAVPPGHSIGGAGPVVNWSIPAGTIGTFTAMVDVIDSNGCQHTTSVDLVIHELPRPVILPLPPVVCTPLTASRTMTFDGQASIAIAPATLTRYAWSVTAPATPPTGFGSTFSTVFAPGTVGLKTATLTIDDSFTCQAAASADFDLRIGNSPVAVAVTPAATVCADPTAPTVLTFDATGSVATSPATIASYTWWSSIGTPSGSGGPLETVTVAPGVYGFVRVAVTIADSAGCADVAYVTVLVVGPPSAVYTATPATLCEGSAGSTVTLDAGASASQHPIDPTLIYSWSTSEGIVSPPAAAVVSLALPRLDVARNVITTLDVTDVTGCSAVTPTVVLIHVDPSPTATMVVVPDVVGSPSSFTGVGVGGTPSLTYSWDFGDNTTDSGPSVSHVYAAAASYLVTLTVTDSVGCTFVTTTTIVVRDSLAGSLSVEPICLGLPSSFEALVAGGTPPLTYNWDFGDGSNDTTTIATNSHTYAVAGDYPVEVVVTDGVGSSLTLTGTARVLPLATISLSTSGPALFGVPQTFTLTSVAPAASVVWTFSDGGGAIGSSVSHTFFDLGVVSATAVYTSSLGCTVEQTIELELVHGTTEVTVSKTVTPGVVEPGDEALYLVVIANGQGPIQATVLDDLLPGGLEYLPGTLRRDGAPMSEPGDLVHLVLDGFAMEPNTSTTIQYRVRVPEAAVAGSYDNRATVSAFAASGTAVVAGPAIATLVVESGEVDLRVFKRAFPDETPPGPGSLVRYEVEYKNVGQRLATAVAVTDLMPTEYVTLEENTDLGVVVGDTITWTVETVPPGGEGRFRYTLRLADDLPTNVMLRNTVVVSSAEPEAIPDDNRAIVDISSGGRPDLTIEKSVRTSPEPAGVGAEATYTLGYSNQGNGVAANVVIDDDYDEERLEITSLPGGGRDENGVLRFDIGELAAGASGSLTYRARVLEGASDAVRNIAQIRSQPPDSDLSNNTASAQFEIVLVPAELRLAGSIAPGPRCKRPQVQIALVSDRFDTAEAMYASAELLRVAGELDSLRRASHPIVDIALLPPMIARLRGIARRNVEALFFESGMGLKAVVGDHAEGAAPIHTPFLSAHAVRADSSQAGAPWCDHIEHRATTPSAIGYGFSAIAAYAEDALAAGAPADRRQASQLLAQAAEAVSLLTGLEAAGGDWPPARWRVIEPADAVAVALVADGGRAGLGEIAALGEGAARLALVARSHPESAPPELERDAWRLGRSLYARLAELVETELPTTAAGGQVAYDGIAAVAEAIRAGAGLDPTFSARLAAALVKSGVVSVGEDARTSAENGRDAGREPEFALMRTALELGEVDTARGAWRRLEADYLDPRLQIYLERPGGAMTYSPMGLARAVAALVGLAAHSEADDASTMLARADVLVQRVAIEAGLQIPSGRRTSGRVPLILGARGDVRVSTALPPEPGELVPVMVDRVGFLGQQGRLRDLSVNETSSGIRDSTSLVSYLSGAEEECQTAIVTLVDRRFVTESGMFAIGAMMEAGDLLKREEAGVRELGADLHAQAVANASSVGMLSGMGLRLRDAPGVGDEGELLAGYAHAAGFGAAGVEPPRPLQPIWLEFDSAEPAPAAVIGQPDRSLIGWEPSRFAAQVSPSTVAQALIVDVQTVRHGLTSGDALARFVGLVRLHAATLKIELIEDALRHSGAVGGWNPELDSGGRALAMQPVSAEPRLRDVAAMMHGVTAYLSLARELAAAESGPAAPIAAAAAQAAAEHLYGDLQALLAADARVESLGLWHATRALTMFAEAAPEHAADARQLGCDAARRLTARSASDVISEAARLGLALDAAAACDLHADHFLGLYRELRDRHFDRSFRLFRGESQRGEDAGFQITDLDVGALVRGLTSVRPRLSGSEREECDSLIDAVVRRMAIESGLQRGARVRRDAGGLLPAVAPHLARAVAVEFVDSTVTSAQVFPGDLAHARFRLTNNAPSSLASAVDLLVELDSGFTYVSGSTRIDGVRGGDAVDGETLRLPLGQLSGGAHVEVSFLVRASPEVRAGVNGWRARAEADATPGGTSERLETPEVSGVLQVERFGALVGDVWLDDDGDGKRGGDEPGVPDVTVALDDGTATVTDDLGEFGFAELLPARYRALLVEESLPERVRFSPGENAKSFDVRSEKESRASFAVGVMDLVIGVVYRDLNGDGRQDLDEPTVAGAVVEVNGNRRVISDRTGTYRVSGLGAGQQELRVARHQPYIKDGTRLRLGPLSRGR